MNVDSFYEECNFFQNYIFNIEIVIIFESEKLHSYDFDI
jgi:hypothetical protein